MLWVMLKKQQNMKVQLTILLLTISSIVFGQTEILKKYQIADSLLQTNNLKEAYNIFKDIEQKCDKKDTLYNYILWYCVGVTTELEKQNRNAEIFDKSLQFGLEALQLIENGKSYFDDKFALREYFMQKNVIISYFGLGQISNALKHKEILYKAYKEKKLPEGLDEYFNFTFFKWEDKNVWGYEWFEELPKDRFSKSFSKIVYYVYSTNKDGTDKDQLYRLHVLMFHNIDPANKIDYVLTKRLETAKNETSGTLYAYTYTKDIDYKKLQADIKEVLKGNYQPKSKKD
ncbi:MAG: hypothetical protein EAZ08_06255 [Cytophagales bacterium]|nr:MAG: hypothetical protein EAZ08_06255 [Cytophagales bacterium]